MLKFLIILISVISSCSTVLREKVEENPLLPEKKSQDAIGKRKQNRKLYLGIVNNSQFLMTEYDYMTHSTAFFDDSPEGHFINDEFHPSYNLCEHNNSDILKHLTTTNSDNITLNWCNETDLFENPLFYRSLKSIEHLAIINLPYSGIKVETLVEMISKTSINLHLDFIGLSSSYVTEPDKKKELLLLFKNLSNMRKLKGLTLSINAEAAEILKELSPVRSLDYLTIIVSGEHNYGFKMETVFEWVSEFKNLGNLRIVYNECGCVPRRNPDFTALSGLKNLEIFSYKERGIESTPLAVFSDKSKVKFVIFDKSVDLKNIPDLNRIMYASIRNLPSSSFATAFKKLKNIKHLIAEIEKSNSSFLNNLSGVNELISLRLTSDVLNQKIMSSVMTLRKLQNLYIETSNPDGPVEIKSHSNLRSVSINFNSNSEHHYVINNMPQLKYFYLNGTNEHGELVLEQKSPSNIERIDISRFTLTKKSNDFWMKQKKLKSIRTLETEMPANLVSDILSLPSLENVFLRGTYESDGYYKSIIELPFQCRKLKYFSIGFFNIGNKGFLTSLGKCRHLKNVQIYDINKKGAGEIEFSPEVEISELNLSNIEFKSLKNLIPLKRLRRLTLKNIQLEKIEKIEFFNNVEYLDLTFNKLPKVEIVKLKDLKNLKNLSIKYNKLNEDDKLDISQSFPLSVKLDIRE